MNAIRSRPYQRTALTLIEFVIVLGLIGLLIGLLLSSVYKVRQAAITTASQNNLRQIGLAVHHFASTEDDRLPMLDGHRNGPTPDRSVLGSLVPYVEGGDRLRVRQRRNPADFRLAVFLSPADPTLADSPHRGAGLSSYAPNGVVFLPPARFPNAFADGTSTTIIIAEHYAYNCQQVNFWYGMTTYSMDRRASFADDGDIRPVTRGIPPVSTATFRNLTFQTAPTKAACNPLLAQTPHREGMLVALGDGSIRRISPTVHPFVYWAAVTPAAGEITQDPW